MVQVSYPGVYIQEVPSGVRTITGVSTSIGAFLGRASKGPIDHPVRLFSIADFDRSFGEAHPASDLAESAKLFFNNGGTDCYVIRIARNAAAASVVLENLAGGNVLRATAKARGTWGNTTRLAVDYNTANQNETFNLRVIHEEGGLAVQTESFTGLSMDPTAPRFAPAKLLAMAVRSLAPPAATSACRARSIRVELLETKAGASHNRAGRWASLARRARCSTT